MAFYVNKTKNYNVKPDEVETFVKELKRAQERHRQPKAAIYRSGKAPEWADEEEDSEDENVLLIRKKGVRRLPRDDSKPARRRIESTVLERSTRTAEVLEVGDEETISSSSAPIQSKAAPIPEKTFDTSALEVLGEAESSSSEEEDADERRNRARQRAQLRKNEPEQEELPVEDEQKQEESGSSEYETDSEDEALPTRTLFKPVFVSRKQRETIKERERLEQEQIAIDEAKKARLAERKAESRKMVVDQLAREEQAKRKSTNEDDDEMPSDDDDNEDEALRQWKVRELRRIKRDNDEREKWEDQERDLERRRTMTDEEIKAENAAKGIKVPVEKSQYRFLQKYYHPGAFYNEELAIEYKNRDFSAPTGADRTVDRTLLPEVLQVKKFGLKGRTKYTHLVDQDTTTGNINPWAAAEAAGLQTGPRGKRMAGTGDVYSKKRVRRQ